MASMKLASLFHPYFHQYLYKFNVCRCIHSPSLANHNYNAELISQAFPAAAYKLDWNFWNPFDTNSYASLLQKCIHIKSLEILHTHVIINGLEHNPILGDKLVIMYAMLGSIENARVVFDKIHERDIISWNAMLRAYARAGNCDETLALYNEMQRDGMQPDKFTFAIALKACAGLSSLEEGKEIHYHIRRVGLESDVYVGAALVNLYGKFGSMEDARDVFDKISQRNVVAWTSMIAGFTENGLPNEALKHLRQMWLSDVKPNVVTLVAVIPACARLGALQQGKSIHGYMIRTLFEFNVVVETAFVDMYAKCGSLNYARQLFDKMSQRNVVSWTAMISGYSHSGHETEALSLFDEMQVVDMTPDSITLANVLLACANLRALQKGKRIHGCMIKKGCKLDGFVWNSLVDMYVKCDSLDVAYRLFDKMRTKDVVSWNVMISGFADSGHFNEALTFYHQMQLQGIRPDSASISNLLSSCTQLGALQHGKCIHNFIIKSGLESDVFSGAAVIDMYAKCGTMEDACQFFHAMPGRDVVSWNAIISGYAQNGQPNEALTVFHQMQLGGITPNAVTMASILPACAQLRDLQQGQWIHDYMVKSGFQTDVFVETALVDMYAKCGCIDTARNIFDEISDRNVISWSAIIAVYTENGQANEALSLFYHMQLAGVKPNSVTLVSVLSACALLGTLQQGMFFHTRIITSGFGFDSSVVTALINMYAKCGDIVTARQIFNKMPEKNVVSWNAMIAGYGMHGYGQDALILFSQMQQRRMEPNAITFISVLSACSHAGLVDEGWQYFHCMTQDYCITPKSAHYRCIVDLLGRAGHLNEALHFISKMHLQPDAGIWGTLLGACSIHCNIHLGERVADFLLEVDPENVGHYVLLSNLYAAAGRWVDVVKIRTMMKVRRLKKTPGHSWIEINKKVHVFLV